MKVKVERRGNLAFIVTELGQKAVIPWDSLCNFLVRYKLDVMASNVQLPKCVEVKPQEIVEEEEAESDESPEEQGE